MQALRDSRPRFKGAITKVATKLDNLKADDAASIARINMSTITNQLSSIEKTNQKFLTNLEDTQQYAPEDDDEQLDAFQEEESASADAFEEAVSITREKANHLITLKKVQRGLAQLTLGMGSLETSLSTSPDDDYSSSYVTIETNFNHLQKEWTDADLPMDHAMKAELDSYTGRLHHLGADVARAKHRSIPVPITSSYPAAPPKLEKNITKLPAIALPTFAGDVLKWPTFWNQFEASVDSNRDLPDSTKLSYLRRAIKDPEAEVILNPSIDGPDTYGRLVKELQLRYRRTKKIHRDLVEKLIQLPSAKYNSSDLRKLVDAATNSLECLQTTKHFSLETFISSLIYSKLPYKLQVDWDKDQPDPNTVMPYSKLFEYVTKTAFTLSDHKAFTPTTPTPEKKPAQKKSFKPKSQVYSVSSPTSNPPTPTAPPPWKHDCLLCKTVKHPLRDCPTWAGFTVDQRLTQVKDKKLCANCLAPGHATADCRSKYRCHDCRQLHHTSLHKNNSVQVSTIISRSRQLPDALLMTAEVLLTGPSGQQLKARAFLDPGAGLSIVSSRITQMLKLSLDPSEISFTTVQGTCCHGSSYLTDLIISSLHSSQKFDCRPAVVKTVTNNIPNKLLAPVHDYPHLTGLCLADPNFNVPARVDILLGSDLWLQLLENAPVVRSTASEPGAQLTAFGWVVIGPAKAQDPSISNSNVLTGHVQPMSNNELYEMAYNFWLSESAEVPEDPISSIEAQVERHYEETVTYSPTANRYQVTLPRKPDALLLGTSKPQAIHRYLSNEASIERKGVTTEFQAQIQGYLDAGHAEPVPVTEISTQPHFYLPMHSVVKKSSTSTKLRVVFDGSATTSSGASLNSILRVGPTLHPPLADILMKFRTYPVALTADIAKMYREVELLPADRDLHRFIWRPTPHQPLQDFRMTRVTFGVSASPYLAIKTLQRTARDHGAEHPIAAAHIRSSFYVDDLLAGAQTEEEASDLFTELRSVLKKGGFNLCKWRSSNSNVLKTIPTDLHEKLLIKDATSDQTSAQPKALGLQWDSREDVMSPTIHAPTEYLQTKRGIISDVSKTFDVLGWIAPAILPMKILFQALWDRGQEWDDVAPPQVIEEHSKWRELMPCLSTKTLPRCYAGHPQPSHQELHGFSDASKKASGAVVYLRSTYTTHEPTVVLVTAKTKVAKLTTPKVTKRNKKAAEKNLQPPSEQSEPSDPEESSNAIETPSSNNAPRTELDAALLLTKLLTHVAAVLGIPLKDVTAWTDNSAVFSWLDGNKREQDRYTTNRVSYILQHTRPSTWKHVPGPQNPADCASRGMDPRTLLHHDLWWQGPQFLHSETVSVPPQPPRRPSEIHQPASISTACPIILQVNTPDFLSMLLIRTNNYELLVSMTAWCFRYFNRLKEGKPSPDNRQRHLSLKERDAAEHWLLKSSQQRSFPTDYQSLIQKGNKKGNIAPTSKLRPLTPCMDPKEGLIRLGGRLEHAALAASQRHPIIIDASDILVERMFQHLHQKHHHCGPTVLLCKTSREFHVVGARRLSRRVCSLCPKCRRVQPRPSRQLMGNLPPERVAADQPAFTNTGMDFAGPFLVGNGRGQARSESHVCIFVCLATKAVHMELTKELTTAAFIRCLQRFTSRRNCPRSLHCDNGSNFVGARNDLDALYAFLAKTDTEDAIRQHLLHDKVEWKFIPAAAPHFGGIWESAVRSMKKHLRRIMGGLIFTYEELETILIQIEHCLNSRPLLPMTCHDSEGVSPLTPGHFIYFNAPRAYPIMPSLPTEIRRQKRWQHCQAVMHHFWTRWSQEYLQTLQSRIKWQKIQPNLQVGDIVIFQPKDHFTCRWPLAKILKTYPGEDGLVRTVLLKPSFYADARKRPVTKLSLVYREEDNLTQPTSCVDSPGSMFRQEASTPEQHTASSQPEDSRAPNIRNAARQPSGACSSPATPPNQVTGRRVQPSRACKPQQSIT